MTMFGSRYVLVVLLEFLGPAAMRAQQEPGEMWDAASPAS